jgi:two-component system, sensor histidine kinase and response regulator
MNLMPKILVIEDEETLLEDILTLLRFEDFDAIGAKDGIAGVQMAHQHHPDLVISDIMMPGLDGYGVLLELQDDPVTRRLPFIFLTAKSDREHLRYGMELGADDYITKPFSQEDLLNAITTRLSQRTAVESVYERKLDNLRQSVSLALPHELRTPLTSLVGFAELLMMDAEVLPRDQVAQMGEAILKAGLRLQRQIKNFLLYAQLEMIRLDPASAFESHNTRLENAEGVIQAAVYARINHHERGQDLRYSVVPATVRISEFALGKLVEELVDNAAKFSKPGQTIAVTGALQDNRYALTVQDQGRGMSPEQIHETGAYLQFERRLYEQQGSGMGLAIARQIADLYDGSLEITSVLGEGTQALVQFNLG